MLSLACGFACGTIFATEVKIHGEMPKGKGSNHAQASSSFCAFHVSPFSPASLSPPSDQAPGLPEGRIKASRRPKGKKRALFSHALPLA